MTFDPEEFLHFATKLASSARDETDLRIAAGRAYYCMFLIARDRLGVTTHNQAHSAVRNALSPRNRTAAGQLDKLRRARVTADYRLEDEYCGLDYWRKEWSKIETIVPVLLRHLKSIP